jgi:hypothetical protein
MFFQDLQALPGLRAILALFPAHKDREVQPARQDRLEVLKVHKDHKELLALLALLEPLAHKVLREMQALLGRPAVHKAHRE